MRLERVRFTYIFCFFIGLLFILLLFYEWLSAPISFNAQQILRDQDRLESAMTFWEENCKHLKYQYHSDSSAAHTHTDKKSRRRRQAAAAAAAAGSKIKSRAHLTQCSTTLPKQDQHYTTLRLSIDLKQTRLERSGTSKSTCARLDTRTHTHKHTRLSELPPVHLCECVMYVFTFVQPLGYCL